VIKQRLETARREAVRDWIAQITEEELREEAAPGGVRKARTDQFEFSFTAVRQTGIAISQFENRIAKLLDKAYAHVSKSLEHKIGHKIPVLLMTREEYAAKYAGQSVSRAAAFWNGQHIVMNGQTEFDAQFAEVIVHELTHAFVQDLVGTRSAVPRWANEGLAEYMANTASKHGGEFPRDRLMFLKQIKKQGPFPPLPDLDALFMQMGDNVQAAYSLSAYAVHVLIKAKGLRAYVAMLKEMRRIRHPSQLDKAMEKHMKVNTKWVENEVQKRL
jgi:hypothetical protein